MNKRNTHLKLRNAGRAVPLALAAGLTLLLFSCGRNEARRVTYNCPANAAEIASLTADLEHFHRETGITLELNPFSGEDKLYAMIVAGKAPDVFYVNNAVRDRLAAEGRLLDLRSFLASDPFTPGLQPGVLETSTSLDGGVYAIGNWSFTAGVYINRTLFQQAGIPMPSNNWTWDDMVSIAGRLTVDRDGDGQLDQYGIFIPSHFVEVFEHMNHAPLQPGALFFSLPRESRDVYTRYLDLMRTSVMPDLRRVQSMGMQAAQMLAQGRVAMLVEAVPNAALYETLKSDYDVVPLPTFPGLPARYFRSASGGLAINATAGDSRAAWKALKWIISAASYYQPNPVIASPDSVIAGWIRRYPRLAGTQFAEVWRRGDSPSSADLRYFVRFSSWTMGPILERLQPMLDRLWAREISVDDIAARIPEINAAARNALRADLQNKYMKESFKKSLLDELERKIPNPATSGIATVPVPRAFTPKKK